MRLMCKNDVETFVMERSAHVRKVKVKEIDNDVIIELHVSWLYKLFFKETFQKWINDQIQENAMYGINYIVKVV